MNRQEFKQIYDLLDAVYELDFVPRKLDAWYDALNRYDFKKMMIAANRYIEIDNRRPKPSDLIKLYAEIRPPVQNKETFKCGLCFGGYVLVEHEIEISEEKQIVVFCYRCKCDIGQKNCSNIPTITDDIINSRYRDIFGIYRLKISKLTKTENIKELKTNLGRWE